MNSTVWLLTDGEADDSGFQAAFAQAAPNAGLCVARRPEDADGYPAPHLVLLDLDLLRESGFDTLRWIRTQPFYKQVPVIVLTSRQEPADADRAYALGANSCLLKPRERGLLEGIVKGIGAYAALLENACSGNYGGCASAQTAN